MSQLLLEAPDSRIAAAAAIRADEGFALAAAQRLAHRVVRQVELAGQRLQVRRAFPRQESPDARRRRRSGRQLLDLLQVLCGHRDRSLTTVEGDAQTERRHVHVVVVLPVPDAQVEY